LGETDAAGSEGICVWRVKILGTVTPEVDGSLIVGKDDKDIGRASRARSVCEGPVGGKDWQEDEAEQWKPREGFYRERNRFI
jgi:hypothetical protein